MATFTSTGRFAPGEACANNDILYGPYTSVHEAHTSLYALEHNAVGRTVGIIDGNNIIEYWYQGGTAEANLVPKQAQGGSSFSGSYNDLTDKPVFATVGGQRIDQGGNIPIEGGSSSPSVPTLQEHSGTAVTIAKLDGGTLHRCTDPLASLTVSALGQDTALEAVVLFETGQDWTGLTMPQGTAWAPMRPMPEAGRRYVMAVQNGIATLCPVVS